MQSQQPNHFRPDDLHRDVRQQADQMIRRTQLARKRMLIGIGIGVGLMMLVLVVVLVSIYRSNKDAETQESANADLEATAAVLSVVDTVSEPQRLIASQFMQNAEELVWEVQVVDGANRPIVNQAVNFSLQPANAALLLNHSATTNELGRATVRIANIEANNPRVLASLPEWDIVPVEATIPTNFISQPELFVSIDTTRTDETAVVGEDIALQFLVRNESAIDARGVRLHAPLPAGTRFVDSERCQLVADEIVCEIGIVTADAEGYDPQFTLNVLQTEAMQLEGFYLTDSSGNRFDSSEQLTVRVEPASLSRIVLLSDKSELLANGVETTTLTVELYDQEQRFFEEPTALSFAIAASQPSITHTGAIAQTELKVEQQATVVYTSGLRAEFVDVIVSTGTLSETVRLTVRQALTWEQVPVGRERRKPGRHLYYQPTDDVNFEIALFGLSPDTSLTIFPQKENAFQRAFIDIWLSTEHIDLQDSGDGIILRQSQPFYVGDEPRRDKFLTNGDMVTINAFEHRVPVLQQAGDFTQVRFEGWLLVGQE